MDTTKKTPAKPKRRSSKTKRAPLLRIDDLVNGPVVKAHFWTWTMDVKIKFVDRDAGRVTLLTRDKMWLSVPMDQLVLSWGGGKLPAKANQ